MASLLPKQLRSIGETETAAILALWSLHVCAALVVDNWESAWHSQFRDYLPTSFLFCQLGLLAWWACLAGPRRFWRVILSLTMFVLLIAFASRHVITALRYIYEVHDLEASGLVFSPYEHWNELDWGVYLSSDASYLTITAPFIFAAFAILGWIVPCKLIRRHRGPDGTADGPPKHVLSEWQFGVRDLFGGTAAVAAVMGLICWLQPYPTWIIDYGRSAGMYPPVARALHIPYIITVVLGTWVTGYFFLGRSICRRSLTILILLVVSVGTLYPLLYSLILPVVVGVSRWELDPMTFGLMLGSTFLDWIILGGSFLLLRMAGFRITRARSRILRRWETSE